ncbi:unnamed protein product [Zymoseptoria tritici ST99CH_3D1]|nr:unnamed protein product [Zymoseptoria tritici ST99CH_3D1]
MADSSASKKLPAQNGTAQSQQMEIDDKDELWREFERIVASGFENKRVEWGLPSYALKTQEVVDFVVNSFKNGPTPSRDDFTNALIKRFFSTMVGFPRVKHWVSNGIFNRLRKLKDEVRTPVPPMKRAHDEVHAAQTTVTQNMLEPGMTAKLGMSLILINNGSHAVDIEPLVAAADRMGDEAGVRPSKNVHKLSRTTGFHAPTDETTKFAQPTLPMRPNPSGNGDTDRRSDG